jgi:hypothetical protein
MKPTLPGGSTVRFPVGRVFIAADQHRVRSRCARDVLWLGTYHRCNAQLEFLNGFDSALFVQVVFVWNLSGKLRHLPFYSGSAYGSRTRVPALRGLCPNH